MAIVSGTWNLEEDLREVISSWLAHDDAIPERWKGDMSPTCVIEPAVHLERKLTSEQKTNAIQ